MHGRTRTNARMRARAHARAYTHAHTCKDTHARARERTNERTGLAVHGALLLALREQERADLSSRRETDAQAQIGGRARAPPRTLMAARTRTHTYTHVHQDDAICTPTSVHLRIAPLQINAKDKLKRTMARPRAAEATGDVCCIAAAPLTRPVAVTARKETYKSSNTPVSSNKARDVDRFSDDQTSPLSLTIPTISSPAITELTTYQKHFPGPLTPFTAWIMNEAALFGSPASNIESRT